MTADMARAEAMRLWPGVGRGEQIARDDRIRRAAFEAGAEWASKRLTITDEHVEAVARARWPYLWSAFETILAGMSIFTPEQAAESAEKRRAEKRDLVRSILRAERSLDAP